MTGTYRFTTRFQAGVEWNPGAHEAGFIGNWTLNPESDRYPMVNLGTSSDRIGTPAGPHAYYVTFAKGFPGARVGPYFSVNYSEYDRQLNFPFGINFQVAPQLTALFMNDGRKSHAMLTYAGQDWSVSAMWIWFKHPGISVSFGF